MERIMKLGSIIRTQNWPTTQDQEGSTAQYKYKGLCTMYEYYLSFFFSEGRWNEGAGRGGYCISEFDRFVSHWALVPENQASLNHGRTVRLVRCASSIGHWMIPENLPCVVVFHHM